MAANTNKSRESNKLSSIRDKDNLGFTKIKNDKDNSAVLQLQLMVPNMQIKPLNTHPI
jgi:hypothetical protein